MTITPKWKAGVLSLGGSTTSKSSDMIAHNMAAKKKIAKASAKSSGSAPSTWETKVYMHTCDHDN